MEDPLLLSFICHVTQDGVHSARSLLGGEPAETHDSGHGGHMGVLEVLSDDVTQTLLNCQYVGYDTLVVGLGLTCRNDMKLVP